MRTLIVTRHDAAVEFVKDVMGWYNAEVKSHITDDGIESLGDGDVVAGVLPVNLIARLNLKGVRTYVITLPNIPPEYRGEELGVEDMKRFGARVDPVVVLFGHDMIDRFAGAVGENFADSFCTAIAFVRHLAEED